MRSPSPRRLVETVDSSGSTKRAKHSAAPKFLQSIRLPARASSSVIKINGRELGGDKIVRVFTSRDKWNALAHKLDKLGDYKPEIVFEDPAWSQLIRAMTQAVAK